MIVHSVTRNVQDRSRYVQKRIYGSRLGQQLL
jgi:hypothetical protein